eukprot:CAMPEP_0114506856 /NCGR_PEP_ID=MMETSP0109-20121206/11673_1 /TAXON_ID=29199 /ORGANISM="Chlorarachnion reptans, Strain CCCM449" /LENGTH=423 /DNA_ID=CAMNT_0001685517 /DNA_START=125 /DNA_END=1396 /DNA_ORIENTATION=+
MSGEDVKRLNREAIEAIRSEDFGKAIECYTKALRAEGKEGKNYFKLLANRSSAYFRDGQYRLALKDSEESIKINDSFYMAYSRKGDALSKLDRGEEALKAYQEALNQAMVQKNVPSIKVSEIQSKVIQLEAKLGKGPGLPGSTAKRGPKDSKENSGESKNIGKPKIPLLPTIEFSLHCLVLLAGIMYAVRTQAYYWCVKMGLAANAFLIYRRAKRANEFKNLSGLSFGALWPALKSWFPREFIQSQRIMLFFPYGVLLISRPMLIGAIPMVGRSLLRLPPLINSIPVLEPLKSPLMIEKVTGKRREIVNALAQFEILAGIYLILMAIAGGGSFLTAIMYWQYLRMCYMIARHPYAMQHPWAGVVQEQWNLLAYKADSLILGTAWVPGVVKSVYTKLKDFLNRMTDPQAQASGGNNMLRSCNIM